MGFFRKKPVVIEAHQWFKNGDHPDDCIQPSLSDAWHGKKDPQEGSVVRYYHTLGAEEDFRCNSCDHTMRVHGWINTLEGGHRVCPGDWIITGVAGEMYPCKPDIFQKTYEPALSAGTD